MKSYELKNRDKIRTKNKGKINVIKNLIEKGERQ
jgi:hypothetical protein